MNSLAQTSDLGLIMNDHENFSGLGMSPTPTRSHEWSLPKKYDDIALY
jgi:hypothetical protein